MTKPTFEQLPDMIGLLLEKVESLEKKLSDMQQLPDPNEELLNVDQAAQFLKLSVPTLYSKVSRGEIPFSKPAKRLYFNRTDLLRWVKHDGNKVFETFDFTSTPCSLPKKFRQAKRSS